MQALYHNTSGSLNTALGLNALLNNTIGTGNVGLGYGAGQNLTTGGNNIDIASTGPEPTSGPSGEGALRTVGRGKRTS
jgi:hypothetical protein